MAWDGGPIVVTDVRSSLTQLLGLAVASTPRKMAIYNDEEESTGAIYGGNEGVTTTYARFKIIPGTAYEFGPFSYQGWPIDTDKVWLVGKPGKRLLAWVSIEI